MRFCCDGVGQRLRDVLLPDDVGEALRAILAGDDLISHADLRFTIYDLRLRRTRSASADRQS